MPHDHSSVAELISTLKQQRDELKVKIHLAAAEARQEWDQAVEKLDRLTSDYDSVKHAVAESAEDVANSLKLVAEEIKLSFTRIRNSL
jgi:uncharacterized membrane-anchored protein YhcB (DUF1043 family)